MSIVKRFNKLKDLDELDVLIDEVNTSQHIIITDMPESLPQGKSSFLIETGPYMKEGIELQFDFVDNTGESIYLEPVAEYLEGTSRRISVEIYNDTAPGTANLIVVGELDEVPTAPGLFADTEPVPEEFQGVYNVRLTKEVIINPVAVNTQPIRFYTQPQISVSERRLGTMERTDPPDKIQTSPFSVEGVPADGFAFKEFGTEEPKQGALAETSTKIIQSKGKTSKFSRMKKSFKAKKGKRKFSLFKRAGHIAKFNSPEQFPFSFSTSAHSFTTKEIDGSIILTSIDSTKYNEDQFAELKLTYPPTLNSAHTMSIEDIGNGSTAFVTKPFTQINADQQEIILPFFGTAKTLFEPPPTASYSTVNIVSYADVLIDRMRTFSGDIFKTKVYVRPEGSFDDFKVLAELPVEAGELLVDPNSVGRGERTGYFENQSDINLYWEKFGGTNGASAGPLSTMNYNNDIVLDAVELSGSLATFTDQMRFQLKSAYKFQLKAGIDYNLTFTAYGKKGVNQRALLLPYISGSSMYASSTEFSDEVTQNKVTENSTYGKRLGALEIPTDGDDEVDFKSVTTEFVPDRNGDAIVQFRNVEGEWYISDISVSPATDTGFSPSFFSFEKEMPPEFQHKRPETFEFMVEFYDSNNNIADSIAFNSGSTFDGANAFMSGNDNTMAGSLFIGGDTTSSGMHFGGVSSTIPETGGAGAQGSGFMRSVGYQGFISASNPSLAGTFGFMIYSGSVLPDSGDNYAGVGLELIGASGSLKFRTNPSVFEVQADAFFVGKTTTQFISGSGGQIEISSSGFHLRPAGEVTASSILLGDKDNNQFLQFDDGQLTVQGNLSVDNIRTPALIDGSPSTVLNASSSIDSQGFASFKSASIAGFVVNPIAIHSSDKSLILSGSGNITGSNVLFSGGKVANWEISGDKLQSINSSNKGIILDADVSTPIITVQEDSNNKIEVYHTTSTNWGLKGISGGNTVFRLGNSNQIAGWTIGNSTIEGGNLILGKDGFVKSADYITDTSGFIISAEENGFAEFENVKIRGTLATTTFEKESVNAVGGQLFVANSAAMTGSNVPSTGSKFTLKNVTGFTKGEILLIKKVTDNGFNTEYVKVVSSSRTNAGGDDDPDGLAGDLFVERGQGYYVRAKKEYVADSSTNGQLRFYTGVKPLAYVSSGQNFSAGDQDGFNVTGGHTHSGSFHVFLTGSVSQVGTDLVSAELRLLNNSNSDSVIGTKEFWSPSDGTGQISKDLFFEHNTLTPSPTGSKIKMQLRVTTDGTDDSYFIMNKVTASLDYGTIGTPTLFGDASGSVGDPIGEPESYTEGQVLVSTGRYISGTGTNTVGTGYIRLNANPKDKATPYMDIVERTGSGIYDIELKARVGDLSGVAGTRNVPAGFNGFGIMSEVAFLSGSQIKLEAPTFLLGDKNSNFVSGSGGNIEISSSKFHVKPDGDIVVRKVNATEGTIGGFGIADNAISSSDGNININANTKAISISDTTFGNTGLQLEYNSGTPRFFAGKSDGGFIKFTGTDVEMSSSAFLLGDSNTAFVSGSGGNIEISSSNFHVSGGFIEAQDMLLQGVSAADYFAYTSATVRTTSPQYTGDGYYINYNLSGKDFTCLYLAGDRDSTRQSVPSRPAAMIRINNAPQFPIGMILAPHMGKGGLRVAIEAAVTVHFAYRSAPVQFTSTGFQHYIDDANYNPQTAFHGDDLDYSKWGRTQASEMNDIMDVNRFGFDFNDSDMHKGAFIYELSSVSQIDGTTADYDELFKILGGTRVDFIKSVFDFRPIAQTRFETYPAHFESGLTSDGYVQSANFKVASKIEHDGDDDTKFTFGTNQVQLKVGDVEAFYANSTASPPYFKLTGLPVTASLGIRAAGRGGRSLQIDDGTYVRPVPGPTFTLVASYEDNRTSNQNAGSATTHYMKVGEVGMSTNSGYYAPAAGYVRHVSINFYSVSSTGAALTGGLTSVKFQLLKDSNNLVLQTVGQSLSNTGVYFGGAQSYDINAARFAAGENISFRVHMTDSAGAGETPTASVGTIKNIIIMAQFVFDE